ncbi:PASTA domain-containing protein [Kocuria atrinae]|uniref:PASTA domain-containing protein n=1 Tax=Kocuria atrinae TaxID=592377 RepID=A0ABP5JE99_9MICC
MRSRSTAGAGLALACLLALTACGGGGSSDDSGNEEPAAVESTAEAATANEIPDLVGMDQSSAEEQLTELGVRFDSKVESSSEDAGQVIAQDPEEGTPVGGDGPQVTLTVAGDPPAVPNVMGSSVDDARRDLEKLGFTVEETDVFAPDAPNGEVVGQDPEAGDNNAATVTLEVARPPQSMPFKDTKPITSGGSSGPQTESAEIGNVEYAEAWVLESHSSFNRSSNEFGVNLAGDYSEVEGKLGINTSLSDTSCKATVTFSNEQGRPLGENTYNVTFSNPVDVKFSVADVIRLNIDARLNADQGDCSLVFGDFQATGLKESSSDSTGSSSSANPSESASEEPSESASPESTSSPSSQ